MKKTAICLLLVMCLYPALIRAEGDSAAVKPNRFDLGLNVLARGETRHGGISDKDNDGKSEDVNFLLERTRLSFDYSREIIAARVTVQNSGIWGSKGNNSLSVFEAWARLNYRGMFAQVGRQSLAYDDERILGSDDWSMTAFSHDLLRLGYEGHNHKAHLMLAYNQNAENVDSGGSYYSGGSQPYKIMQTLWYHFDFPKIPLGVSVLGMNIGMQGGTKGVDDRNRYQQLVGGHLSFTPRRWIAEASYYHQFGRDEHNMKINAWMMAYKGVFQPSDRYGFKLGYDYLSGDPYFAVPKDGGLGLTQHKVIKGFNPLYGSHHKFYGAMDFFYVSTYYNGFSPGLQNVYFGAFYSPIPRLRFETVLHYLAIATKLKDIDRTLGYEVELNGSFDIVKNVKLSAGFTFMTGSKTMELLKRSEAGGRLYWGWLSLVINPRIFSVNW